MNDECPHIVFTLRLVEEEPRIIVELRCAECDELLWLGGEAGGMRGDGMLVRHL